MKRNLWLLLCIIFLSYETVLAQLSIQASQSMVCAGTPVTLYAIGSLYQSHWQPGSVPGKTVTFYPMTTTTYTLISGLDSARYTVYVCPNSNCTTTNTSFVPLLLNTGNRGLSSILDFGEQDAHWMISRTLNGTYIPAIASDDTHIPGNYSKPIWPNAQWIGPDGMLSSPGSGTYFFRVQFTLTTLEAGSLVLNMQFMADNTVMGVSVNNVLVPNSATPGSSIYGFQSPNASSVNMQSHWIEGLNTISVQINDLGGYVGFVAQLNPHVVIPTPEVKCKGKVFISADTLEICKGDSAQLIAENAVSYSWLPATGLSDPSIANPKASPLMNTTYYVKGIDSAYHVSYDSVVVIVYDMAHINLGSSDTTRCSGQLIILDVSMQGTSVLWQDGSTNPVYIVSDSGTYYVTVTNRCGIAYDTLRVHPCCETLNIPNLFTPNEDQHNEYFHIGCLGTGGWNLKVFNCWGALVYSNSDYQNNWNGNHSSDGVYYYQLSKSNKEEYKGWVQIIR
ncbi:MAG: gliding motility-associated C-terminal domain-containing protein [Cytophagaceae bacterium]|nr:gliding motility-associated C-terminal domain-containing protein [Cytophagaceae bacterium]